MKCIPNNLHISEKVFEQTRIFHLHFNTRDNTVGRIKFLLPIRVGVWSLLLLYQHEIMCFLNDFIRSADDNKGWCDEIWRCK